MKVLAVSTVTYWFVNLVCFGLCSEGLIYPPWTVMMLFAVLPLVFCPFGFAFVLSYYQQRDRLLVGLGVGLGFAGLMLLTSALNFIVLSGAAAQV